MRIIIERQQNQFLKDSLCDLVCDSVEGDSCRPDFAKITSVVNKSKK